MFPVYVRLRNLPMSSKLEKDSVGMCIPRFIVLLFNASDVGLLQMKGKAAPAKIMTFFMAVLSLLWWRGTKPKISLGVGLYYLLCE